MQEASSTMCWLKKVLHVSLSVYVLNYEPGSGHLNWEAKLPIVSYFTLCTGGSIAGPGDCNALPRNW